MSVVSGFSACSCRASSSSTQAIESRVRVTLGEDLGAALANGAVLCQLANQLRPRSVPLIHVPSPAVVSWGTQMPGFSPRPGGGGGLWARMPGLIRCWGGPDAWIYPELLPLQPKLNAVKSRKNVESFLEACRRMGVPEVPGGRA